MKKYDVEKIKNYIEKNRESIKSVYLGMHEDWFWTAEEVFKDGEYTIELNENTKIAGILGSTWATPVMQVEFKDGTEKIIACYTGESDGVSPYNYLGCISAEVQKTRDCLKIES